MAKQKFYLIYCDPWDMCFQKVEKLELKHSLFKIEIWDNIRKLSKMDSKIGKELKSLLDNAEVIPDAIINPIWEKAIKKSKAKNVYFYNYPTAKEDWIFLKKILKENKIEFQKAWYIRKKSKTLTKNEHKALEHIRKSHGSIGVESYWNRKTNHKKRTKKMVKYLSKELSIKKIDI